MSYCFWMFFPQMLVPCSHTWQKDTKGLSTNSTNIQQTYNSQAQGHESIRPESLGWETCAFTLQRYVKSKIHARTGTANSLWTLWTLWTLWELSGLELELRRSPFAVAISKALGQHSSATFFWFFEPCLLCQKTSSPTAKHSNREASPSRLKKLPSSWAALQRLYYQ